MISVCYVLISFFITALIIAYLPHLFPPVFVYCIKTERADSCDRFYCNRAGSAPTEILSERQTEIHISHRSRKEPHPLSGWQLVCHQQKNHAGTRRIRHPLDWPQQSGLRDSRHQLAGFYRNSYINGLHPDAQCRYRKAVSRGIHRYTSYHRTIKV